MKSTKRKKGFTIIELLVVISIMVVMFGVGFANYKDFQRKQYLESAVTKVKADLFEARELALSGKMPAVTPPQTGCNGLWGYLLKVNQLNDTYDMGASCGPGGPEPNPATKCYATIEFGCEFIDKPVDQAGNIDITVGGSFGGASARLFWFNTLGEGTNRPGNVTITFDYDWGSGSLTKEIIVTPEGDIYDQWP